MVLHDATGTPPPALERGKSPFAAQPFHISPDPCRTEGPAAPVDGKPSVWAANRQALKETTNRQARERAVRSADVQKSRKLQRQVAADAKKDRLAMRARRPRTAPVGLLRSLSDGGKLLGQPSLPDAPALARLDKLAPPQVSCLFDAFHEQRHRGPTIGGGDAWAQSAQQERPPPPGRKRYTWVMQRARDSRTEPAGALGVEVGVRPLGT